MHWHHVIVHHFLMVNAAHVLIRFSFQVVHGMLVVHSLVWVAIVPMHHLVMAVVLVLHLFPVHFFESFCETGAFAFDSGLFSRSSQLFGRDGLAFFGV